MRSTRIPIIVSALACTFAQTPAPGPVPDDKVVAKVNEQSVTAGQLRELLIGAPPEAMTTVRSMPDQFLKNSFMYRKMRDEAIAKEVHKQVPYTDRLEWKRLEVLRGAILDAKGREFKIKEDDAERRYQTSKADYSNATVRLLFLAGDTPVVRAKAAGLLKQARAGAGFAALATRHSEDPDTAPDGGLMSPVVPESRVPKAVKEKLFAAKPGDTILVPYDGNQYLFRLETVRVPPYEEVKQAILERMLKEQLDAWVGELLKTVEVKIVNAPFFRTLPMYAAIQEGGGTGVEVPKTDIDEKTVLAVINGAELTGDRFTGMMQSISPAVRANAVRQPESFLQQYGLMRRMAEEAEKAGLHLTQPYKNQIRYNEEFILAQAAMDNYMNNITIGPDEQRKAYDDAKDRFRVANTRAIYVAFSVSPPPQTDPNGPKVLNEAEAREKVESIRARLRAGADFAALAAVHSQDEETRKVGGLLPSIHADEQRYPQVVRDAIFAIPEGEVGEPLRMPNGFYLIKVEKKWTRTYEEVKDKLYEELRMARFQTWFGGLNEAFHATIDDPAAFRQVVEQAVPDTHKH